MRCRIASTGWITATSFSLLAFNLKYGNDALVDGNPRVGVQLAPDHVPPQWPDGSPQQIHLDLWVDDIDAAHEEVVSLGAKLLKPKVGSDAEDFQVYADPAGHPFCLCWAKKAGLA